MKNIAIILVCALAYCFGVQAQSSIPHSQAGFDVEKTGIAQGKIETVAYNSKPSVRSGKHWFIPLPASAKARNTPYFIFCMVSVAMNWSGSIMANRKSFSITCMPKAN